MTSAEQKAIDQFKSLPDAPRAELASLIVEYTDKWRDLTDKLQRAGSQLDSGEAMPGTTLFAELRSKYGG